MSNTYQLGESVRARGVFRDVEGELLDPGTVVCMVKAPDGTETSYTFGTDPVERDSVGVYHFWIATPASGTYAYRWKGVDGDIEIGNEETFYVEASEFANP